jgi:hypothetical protein
MEFMNQRKDQLRNKVHPHLENDHHLVDEDYEDFKEEDILDTEEKDKEKNHHDH